MVWIAIFGGIILLMLFKDRMDTPGDVLNQYQFQELVDSNQIAQATINYNPQNSALNEIIGQVLQDGKRPEGGGAVPRQGAAVPRAGEEASHACRSSSRASRTRCCSASC